MAPHSRLPRLDPTLAGSPRLGHNWLPIVVLALGAVSALLLLLVEGGRKRVVGQDVALLRTTAEIRLRLTTAHLWLEERLSGDPVELPRVTDNLEHAEQLAKDLQTGTADHPPLTEPELVRRAGELRADIAAFRRLAEERLSRLGQGEPVGAGSGLDRETDRFFDRSGLGSRVLEAAVETRMRHNEERARTHFTFLLVAWVSIVGLAAVGLWQRQRRQGMAEEALQQSRAQLLESQKMDAVGRLAGGLAHDINNYVTAITSQCELVKMQTGDPRVARKMEMVIGTAGKISSLVRRLLTFSRRQPVATQVVSINALIEGLRPMLARLLGEDIELGTVLAPDLWSVEIDPSQAEQVILNLVVNAREASPRGGQITLETVNQRVGEETGAPGQGVPPGEYVLLAVSDTGCGIPRELRDKIFEPFFTTKEKGTASGLGLATVYGIVHQQGGTITVYSEVDRGTTFKVYLPRSFQRAARLPVRHEVLLERGAEVILLIEDNEELREATRELLTSLGYQVLVAGRGEEGVEILAGDTPVDLVISDVVMPGLTGSDLLERIRALRPELALIFVSGYTDNVVLRHGLLEGEFEFLEKPYSPEQLAAKVRQVLGGKKERT